MLPAPVLLGVLTTSMLLLVVLTGCSSYDRRYSFEPRPAEATLSAPGAPGTVAARALVSVVGVRYADPQAGLPTSVEVRVRVENVSGDVIRIDPATLQLVSADLQQFAAPIVEPATPIEVALGAPELVHAWFPFPDDPSRPPFDLSGLKRRGFFAAAER